jgi:uncharacterized damage-inducible protein DinB
LGQARDGFIIHKIMLVFSYLWSILFESMGMGVEGNQYLTDIVGQFRKLKDLADRALAQVSEDNFFIVISEVSNSIGIIVKHMAGNMRSRWRDFLTTDGEKPDRHRDSEFIIEEDETREILMTKWEEGWDYLFETLQQLKSEDLKRTVYIRSEPHTVMEAIHRQLTHYAYHVGQIVYMARHYAGDKWQTLSVPKGESGAFNEMMRRKLKEK